MKIVIFSDTHGLHDQVKIPDGDMLIFAGDMCGHSKLKEVIDFNTFMAAQPHQYKIVIAGNHDWPFQRDPGLAKAMLNQVVYLQDDCVEVKGLKIYGSPWQPEFCNWAFNLPRDGEQIKRRWDAIPDDTDILITHGPPAFILDSTLAELGLGCDHLRRTVFERVKLKLHVFGHIHESYGVVEDRGIKFVNACVCDGNYNPINPTITVDI